MPPAPVSVTSRCLVTSSTTSRRDASRPINSDTGSGRFDRGADGGDAAEGRISAVNLISTPCHRSDQIAVIAECLPQRRDLSLEVVFLDDPVRPDPAHQ